jgi:phosphate:Na+ symporter
MPLEVGIAVILGAKVGTCGTALLASIGKNPEAVQVGMVHLIFNILGVLFWVFFIPQMADMVRHVSPSYPELQGVARLAAETPRQVANAHTIFSVASTLILIWFTGPIARLAEFLVPKRAQEVKRVGDPLYLDKSSLTVPSVGLQRVRIELTRLGQEVLDIVRRGTRVVSNGTIEEINLLLDRDKEVDRLASEILHYIGHLSQVEHSEDEGQRMVGFTQIVSTLESISGIVGTNLVSVSQQRLTHQIDLTRLRDPATTQFTDTVMRNLVQAIRSIDESYANEATEVIAARAEIEQMAAAARQVVLAKLQLADKTDVLAFRLAMDLIEHGRQIAQFARALARGAEECR